MRRGHQLGLGDPRQARERLADDADLDLGLQIRSRVLEIATTATPGDMRARRLDSARIRFDDARDHRSRVVLRLVDDVDVDEFTGKSALDEDDPPVVEASETIALGHDLLDADRAL